MKARIGLPLLVVLLLLLGLVAIRATRQERSNRPEPPRLKMALIGKAWTEKKTIAPLPLSSGQLLATVGNTLYMINSKNQIDWKWSVGNGANIIDQPIVDSVGVLYVIALDGQLFAIDPSGKEKWHFQLNGSANFRQIQNYRRDQVLVVVDMKPYRESKGIDTEDKLFVFKDGQIVTEKGFPRSALLQVWEDKVLAISQTKDGIELSEVLF